MTDDGDDYELLYAYCLLGDASLTLTVFVKLLIDNVKHSVLSNDDQIYKTYIVEVVG
jgi:hypothetical protein